MNPFHLGEILITDRARSDGHDPSEFLSRHGSGEKKHLVNGTSGDDRANPLYSNFTLSNGTEVWVGTEPDHTLTLMFLDEEAKKTGARLPWKRGSASDPFVRAIWWAKAIVRGIVIVALTVGVVGLSG